MSRILIEKARRRLERETGTIYGPLEGRLRFALAFPGPYRLGMSSLGFQIVYGLLNSIPGVACERVFLPDPEDVREFRRSRTRLFSSESQTPLAEFDVLAFSISYELDYTNLAQILDLAGLAIFAADRDESHPLVIAGGPCATFNPEPLAEIVDAFAIGDAEEMVGEMAQAIQHARSADREALLAALSGVAGVYVPRFYVPRYNADGTCAGMDVLPPAPERVQKRIARDLDRFSNLSVILTPEAEFSGMLLAEVSRGCGRLCRFCVAGYAGLPPRPRQIGALPEGARVGLVGSAVFDHPEAQAICARLTGEGRQLSVSSIRIESLTDELAGMMYRGGQRTMTIAPEAGTERLRRVINKPTTDEEVLDAARMAAQAGFARLKLYFMVGLPTETSEDVESIVDLVRQIADQHPSLRMQASVSCYVPKPWTPFQWCPVAPEQDLVRKLARIRKGLGQDKRVELTAESPREAHVQAWLARGDRRLGRVIAAAADQGLGYERAAAGLGIDTSFYASRKRDRQDTFPWDHIDLLVTKDYLWEEYIRAFEGRVTPGCTVGSCTRCGVCRASPPPQEPV